MRVSEDEQTAKLQGSTKTRTVERPRAVCKNIVFPKPPINQRTENKLQLHKADPPRARGRAADTAVGRALPRPYRHGSASTLYGTQLLLALHAHPPDGQRSAAAQTRATSTYLGLPLSPETSSPSEGRNSALRTNTGSGDNGYVLRFGKHFSKISHI